MKKFIRITLVLFTFFTFAVLVLYITWLKVDEAEYLDGGKKNFVIEKGLSGVKIGEKLEKEGLIKSSFAFKVYIRLKGVSTKIPPGSYEILSGSRMEDVLNTLLLGPKDVWVLVPEGLRREQVAEVVADSLYKQGEEKELFIEDFLVSSKDLEGKLFPDTYLFSKEVSPETVVIKMNQTFFSKMSQVMSEAESKKVALEFDVDEIVNIASIIEREEVKNSQRPIVSGILQNRLKIGMALQADATVQYAIANLKCNPGKYNDDCEWWPKVGTKDLKVDSAFNTYLNVGLPVAPISNPGFESLRAVVFPLNTDDLFYIHDEKGVIHTAKNFEEHSQNISRYLR